MSPGRNSEPRMRTRLTGETLKTPNQCDHVGHRRYVRRVFSNGTIHFCVQCQQCRETVLMQEHGMRPYIRAEEIPKGRLVGEWVERWQKPQQTEIDT